MKKLIDMCVDMLLGAGILDSAGHSRSIRRLYEGCVVEGQQDE